MIGLYLTVLIVVCLIAYGGMEETMRLFYYVDLRLRFIWIQFRMLLMRERLKRDLKKHRLEYKKLFKEIKDDQR